MAATNHPLVGRRRSGCRGGFTLVELLVVIAIILVLISILLPAIAKGYRNGVRTRMAADLAAIVTALEAYRTDHGDIPRVPADPSGATAWMNVGDALLCRALIAPLDNAQDGQDGNGFRTRADIGGEKQGKVYGPYISPDKFRMKYDVPSKSLYVADQSGARILYLPGRKNANINVPNGFVSDVSYAGTAPVRPMFNLRDWGYSGPSDADRVALFNNGGSGVDRLRILLGADSNGVAIDPQLRGEFILWGAGPDEKFGYEGAVDTDPKEAARQRGLSDDVTYPAR